MKKVGLAGPLAAATMTLALVSAGGAFAQSKFQCEPGETYIMNVMVSAHPYWVPVYQGFKQAAEAMGCETVFSGTPDYDITKQIASFEQDLVKKPGRRPAASDAVGSVHRADQPRDRQRRRRGDLRGRLAEVEAHRLHHLGQSRRGQVRRRGDRQAGRRQRRIRGPRESRARATTTCASRRSSPTWRRTFRR